MKKRAIAFAALLATTSVMTAAPTKSVDTFGWQLDCATTLALNAFNPNASESNRVRRAVDSCMSKSLPKERIIRVSANATMMALEERRESLVDAVLQRLQLCRDTGIPSEKFASACPQLFAIDPLPSK
ncbi:MAG TPA: hypothetical protein VGE12_14520 [Noviherbaspirillum sp.]